MAKRIPAKQVVRAGTKSDLREKLIDRELGFEPTEFMLYVKYGDEIYPAGAVSIPSPGTNSVYMGKEDGTMGWADLPATPAPYDEELNVYESLDGVPFGAAFAYKDSEGNDIQMNVYYSHRVRERHGRLVLVNESESHFVTVRMGERDSAWLGALLPTQAPSPDGTFRKGDILMVDGNFGSNGPMLNWKHPESDDVREALPGKMLVVTYGETTQAVINAAIANRYILVLEYFENDSTVPLYAYYSHSTDAGPVFRSTVYSNGTVKQFSVLYTNQWVTEIVPVNKVFVAVKDSTTYAEVNTALANNQMLVLEYYNEGSTVPNYAYFYGSSDAGVTFHTLPDNNGNYKTFTLLYTNQWSVADECVCKVFVATYGVTSAQEISNAVAAGYSVLLPAVPFGRGHRKIDMILSSVTIPMTAGSTEYFFSSPIIGNSFGWAALIDNTWSSDIKTIESVSHGSIISSSVSEQEQFLLQVKPLSISDTQLDFIIKGFVYQGKFSFRVYSSGIRSIRFVGTKHTVRNDQSNPLNAVVLSDNTLTIPSSGYASYNPIEEQESVNNNTIVTLDLVVEVNGTTYGNLRIKKFYSGSANRVWATYDGF